MVHIIQKKNKLKTFVLFVYLDIGRVSTTPSFLTNNEDIKKETAKSSVTRSRRARHGLSSKHVSQ